MIVPGRLNNSHSLVYSSCSLSQTALLPGGLSSGFTLFMSNAISGSHRIGTHRRELDLFTVPFAMVSLLAKPAAAAVEYKDVTFTRGGGIVPCASSVPPSETKCRALDECMITGEVGAHPGWLNHTIYYKLRPLGHEYYLSINRIVAIENGNFTAMFHHDKAFRNGKFETIEGQGDDKGKYTISCNKSQDTYCCTPVERSDYGRCYRRN